MLTYKIHEWLSGKQNFIVGRVLFNHLGSDENIKELLKKGESHATKEILLKALQGLTKVETAKRLDFITQEAQEMGLYKDDVILNALSNEWKEPFARMNYLRAKLDHFGESNSKEAIAARYEWAQQIDELEKTCMFIWAKRDHYLQHGTLPDVKIKEKQLPADPFELAKHIENIKKSIRKNRAKMQKPGAGAKYAELYQNYLAEFKNVTGKDYIEKVKQ